MDDGVSGSPPAGTFTTVPPVLSSSTSRISTPGTSDAHDDLKDQYGYPLQGGAQGNQVQFDSQRQQQFHYPHQPRQHAHPSTQATMNQSQLQGRPSPLNMASLGTALPEINYAQTYAPQPAQRFPGGQSTTAISYPFQGLSQFPGQPVGNQPSSPSFNVQFPHQYQNIYAGHQQAPSQVLQPGSTPNQQYYASQGYMVPPPLQQQQVPPYYYQQSQYVSQLEGFASTPYTPQYAGRGTHSGDGGVPGRQRGNEQLGPNNGSGGSIPRSSSIASIAGPSSTPRGPPRKPKQSGHALWVGNLPPGANVSDLKDHFSREATEDILSVFLISKSNCAFVNYKSEESCTAAMARFHDSRFQGVRLVCRLRRSSANAGPGVPTGPAALTVAQPAASSSSPAAENIRSEEVTETKPKTTGRQQSTAAEKYFVVKSLTVEDLELSVRNGIWATQSHNEEALNTAYETVDAVYLIFSANKSGEYFGYARMISQINDDPAAAIEFAPKAQAVEDPDLPKAIPTMATEFAPKGRIIDDSARGTIFWEAETDDTDGAGDTATDAGESRSEGSDQEADANSTKAWGKPFKVEWMSTNRLPFYRTRGLRNAWNSNREVKIARDGTELETLIGRRLVQMFHREPSPVTSTMSQIQMPSMMGGYPHIRQF